MSLSIQPVSDGVQTAVVVVDPYSSGKYLLHEFENLGVTMIAVRSTTKMSKQYLRSHDTNLRFFVKVLEFEDMAGGVQQLVDSLGSLPYKIIAVLPGSEPGVVLANLLAHELRLPTANPIELLPARTDKAEMQDALRKNGLLSAKQFKSGNLEQLLEWARNEGQWPLVAKPVGGAGSEGIFFCNQEDDIKAAHKHIIGNCSSIGALNTQLALQEFLRGDEYIVDTVSFDGKHICVALWVYQKIHGLPWNHTAIMPSTYMLLPAAGEIQDALVGYVFKVLDAVGLKYGPCHTEVILTDRGPVLVEVNARMHGLQGPRLIELCTGVSLATYTIDSMVFGGKLFQHLYDAGCVAGGRYLYPLQKNCKTVCLMSPVEGWLQSSIANAIAKMNLPSAIEVLPTVTMGEWLYATKDLPTLAGSVLMVHESIDQINADIQKIRDAEARLELYPVLLDDSC
eukprot:TRINITY_DN3067_c0_g1_i1.p1 TRINITY_DN3067_c0_g1~~TRINITY_DN3067_c0_g1_i1.p1  ORF type:complete len:453 (+),score=71.92 TRINITY_DN3067_c0_g1_i1:67-1425(+)